MPIVEVGYFSPYREEILYRGGNSDIDINYALVNYLKSRNNINLINTVISKESSILSNIRKFLFTPSDFLIIPYPDIIFTPKGIARGFFSLCIYLLLKLKSEIKRQKIVFYLVDLIGAQSKFLGLRESCLSQIIYNYEKYILLLGDYIISPSMLFKEFLAKEYKIPIHKILVVRRTPYFSSLKKAINPRIEDSAIKVLYAGELSREEEKNLLSLIIQSFRNKNNILLYIAGPRGEWLYSFKQENIKYLGVLNRTALEEIARECHMGLILYKRNFYTNMCSSTKYSFYVSNGLAVASTDVEVIRNIIIEDGTGFAEPEISFVNRLEEALENLEMIARWRRNSLLIGEAIRSGFYLDECFNQLWKLKGGK